MKAGIHPAARARGPLDPGLRRGDGIGFVVFLLEDIRRALVAGEQIDPVGGADKRLKRVDAAEQADQIVLPAEREHRVDQVVADACFTLLDFEAVGKEGQENLRKGVNIFELPPIMFNFTFYSIE